jgi:hypothetical protein
LRPLPRRLVRAGLVAAAISATLAMALHLAPPRADFACSLSLRRPSSGFAILVQTVVDAVALLVVGVGLALIELAGCWGRWRFGRLRFALSCVVPLAVGTLCFLNGVAVRPNLQRIAAPVIAFWPLVALAALLLGLGWRLRRQAPNPRLAALLLLPFVATLASTFLVGAFSGEVCRAVRYLHYSAAFVGNVAAVGAVAMLLWLAFDGLRLSGDVGGWLLDRVAPSRLTNLLLLVKALAFVAVLVAIAAGHGPDAWKAQLDVLWPSLLAVLPAAALIFVPLITERSVDVAPDRFPALARRLGVAAAAWLLPVVVLVPLPLLGLVVSQWSRAVVVLVAMVLAAVVGVTWDRRHRRPWQVCVIGAVIITLGAAVWATWQRPSSRVSLAVATSPGEFALVLLGSGAIVLVGLVVLAHTRHLREFRTYIYVVITWMAFTFVAGQLTPSATPSLLVIDVAVLLGAGALFLVRRVGWLDHAVSDPELALLLVTTTVLIELPLLIGLLPPASGDFLMVLAFLGPGLTTLTLDAAPLNRNRPGRTALVVGAVGALCVGYGLVLTALSDEPELLPVIQDVTDDLLPSFALPLSAVLVAALSIARVRATAEPDS